MVEICFVGGAHSFAIASQCPQRITDHDMLGLDAVDQVGGQAFLLLLQAGQRFQHRATSRMVQRMGDYIGRNGCSVNTGMVKEGCKGFRQPGVHIHVRYRLHPSAEASRAMRAESIRRQGQAQNGWEADRPEFPERNDPL